MGNWVGSQSDGSGISSSAILTIGTSHYRMILFSEVVIICHVGEVNVDIK